MTNQNVGVYDFVKNVMAWKEMDEETKYNFMIDVGATQVKTNSIPMRGSFTCKCRM